MIRIKETKNITLLLSDFLKKDQSNLQELFKWFKVEEEDKGHGGDYVYYEKELKIVLDGWFGNGKGFDVDIDYYDKDFPSSCNSMLDEIALENEYWLN